MTWELGLGSWDLGFDLCDYVSPRGVGPIVHVRDQ